MSLYLTRVIGFLPLAYLGWPVRPGTWAEGLEPPGGLTSVPAEVRRALLTTRLTDGTGRQVPLRLRLVSPPTSQRRWSIPQPLLGGSPRPAGSLLTRAEGQPPRAEPTQCPRGRSSPSCCGPRHVTPFFEACALLPNLFPFSVHAGGTRCWRPALQQAQLGLTKAGPRGPSA